MTDLVTAGSTFEYTPTGLIVHGTPGRDEWLKATENLMLDGDQIDALQDMWRWNVGDMLVYGEGRFGEEYAQAVGYEKQTVRNIITVCRQISKPRRRRPDEVRFWKHYECIGLAPDQQDALLERAAAETPTKMEIRAEQRLLRGVEPPRVYTVQGKAPFKDVHGPKNVLVIEYWPDTEQGNLPKGFVNITIKEQ